MSAPILAYMTVDEEGSPAMLFFNRDEAVLYCEEGEQPIALIAAPAAEQGKEATP